MKKCILFLLSALTGIYAKANQTFSLRVPKSQIIYDQQNFKKLAELEKNGDVLIYESADHVDLVFKNQPHDELLFEQLRQRGLVTTRDSVAGSDCDGICTKREK